MSRASHTLTLLRRYKRILIALESLLRKHGEIGWSPRLKQWITEFDQLQRVHTPPGGFKGHVQRTLESFGGMGSLNDIVISRPSGHRLFLRFKTFRANARLKRLVSSLYTETTRLLEEIAAS